MVTKHHRWLASVLEAQDQDVSGVLLRAVRVSVSVPVSSLMRVCWQSVVLHGIDAPLDLILYVHMAQSLCACECVCPPSPFV